MQLRRMVLPMSFDLQGLRLQVVRCGQGYDRSCEPKIESASVDTADKREATGQLLLALYRRLFCWLIWRLLPCSIA